jgi:RNase H-fold protein (predicted Holliday junction resolvase)
MVVMAVDPGRSKCGLAVVSLKGILYRRVVPREEIAATVRHLMGSYSPHHLLVGGSTGSRQVVQELRDTSGMEPEVVDERHTTERARQRYYVENPPRGLWRLVPLGMQVPSVPVDDFAAVVMAEDYLKTHTV